MGSGTAALGSVAPGFTPMTGKIIATYNGAGYTFTDGSGATVTPNSTATNGANTDYTFGGLTFSFGGTPKAGDSFTLGSNAGAVKNNGNALSLAKLQNAKIIGGVSSFNDAYAQLVNDVAPAPSPCRSPPRRRTASRPRSAPRNSRCRA
ncbi:hypothetical protein AWV80_05010 [Cupriavidus sp. UYMU48A]|nr:hypothetical protein AWV80_05010 [Cupriavidus sp. UYMU48A]